MSTQSALAWTITRADGTLVRSIRAGAGMIMGFHPVFGFISQAEIARRQEHRRRRGLNHGTPSGADLTSMPIQFRVGADGRTLVGVSGCAIESTGASGYTLASALGKFGISWTHPEAVALSPVLTSQRSDAEARERALDRALAIALLLLFLVFGVFVVRYASAPVVEEQLPEPVTVTIAPEKRVVVPKLSYQTTQDVKVQTQDKQVKRAIQQDLGFLGLLGRKDLKKALGGMPTDLKSVSPGAGAGGNAGSGGELLVGLGQGVKRTTVGNSGVAGLGGIGTKGAGGGAGGYGNSMVGSGEGKGLTSIPLSDDMVLEGGLDRIVIQATIAKYLNQVRACYEQGLKRKPGMTGQVAMQFEVAATGRLNYSRVGKSSLGDADVEQCIATRMMGWQFPKPLGGVNVKVNYPFLLRPVSS